MVGAVGQGEGVPVLSDDWGTIAGGGSMTKTVTMRCTSLGWTIPAGYPNPGDPDLDAATHVVVTPQGIDENTQGVITGIT